jgi:hypothetical protein
MAFSFDSLLAISSLLLCAVAALAWRLAGQRGASVRLNLRFAAILFAALGVAGVAAALNAPLADTAFAIALLVMSLGGVALGLSLFQPRPAPPLPASMALVGSLACGLVATVMGLPLFAFGCLALAALAMLPLGLARWQQSKLAAMETVLGALALFLGMTALANNAMAACFMLFASGLLGLACASQARVEQQAG